MGRLCSSKTLLQKVVKGWIRSSDHSLPAPVFYISHLFLLMLCLRNPSHALIYASFLYFAKSCSSPSASTSDSRKALSHVEGGVPGHCISLSWSLKPAQRGQKHSWRAEGQWKHCTKEPQIQPFSFFPQMRRSRQTSTAENWAILHSSVLPMILRPA